MLPYHNKVADTIFGYSEPTVMHARGSHVSYFSFFCFAWLVFVCIFLALSAFCCLLFVATAAVAAAALCDVRHGGGCLCFYRCLGTLRLPPDAQNLGHSTICWPNIWYHLVVLVFPVTSLFIRHSAYAYLHLSPVRRSHVYMYLRFGLFSLPSPVMYVCAQMRYNAIP